MPKDRIKYLVIMVSLPDGTRKQAPGTVSYSTYGEAKAECYRRQSALDNSENKDKFKYEVEKDSPASAPLIGKRQRKPFR
jgi:hypothetical protein